jgi:uncharacterized protein (TIGR02266 family)
MEQTVLEKPQKAPDRRKALRNPLLILKVTDPHERKTLFGYAKNISRGGLFITSINPREPGERFWIRFEIPSAAIQVECECEVVWNRKYKAKVKKDAGYGVRFIDLPPTLSSAIETWVQKNE